MLIPPIGYDQPWAENRMGAQPCRVQGSGNKTDRLLDPGTRLAPQSTGALGERVIVTLAAGGNRRGILMSLLLWGFAGCGPRLHADRLIESFHPPLLYRWHTPEGIFPRGRLSLDIPWLWSRGSARAPMLLEARGENRLPVLRVMNLDEPIWLPLRYATRAAASQLKSLGDGVKVVSETTFQSPEGIRVNLGEVHWMMHIGTGLPLRSLFVSTFHEGRWVLVNVTTRLKPQEEFPARLKALALSLKFEEE